MKKKITVFLKDVSTRAKHFFHKQNSSQVENKRTPRSITAIASFASVAALLVGSFVLGGIAVGTTNAFNSALQSSTETSDDSLDISVDTSALSTQPALAYAVSCYFTSYDAANIVQSFGDQVNILEAVSAAETTCDSLYASSGLTDTGKLQCSSGTQERLYYGRLAAGVTCETVPVS